ncbi:hypothetical protein GCM10009801_29910 [Streptomyces albiaxialis]|uniref:Aromatic ring-opening dioxygenase LigA n=1 Tax=Streptomyces albiaxialis TaxID=329523 RepID=A0ABN2VWJ9_9ACTN
MPDEGDDALDGARERDRQRRRRHRILWGAAAVVVVLGITGLALKPTATDWWVARSACDGGMPDGAMDELRGTTRDADARLKTAEESFEPQLGRYTCEVGNEDDERVVDVEAYTRADDIHARMSYDFQEAGERATTALPAGLPGYERREGLGTVLLRDCPGLGKDASGRTRQLYVSVLAGSDARPAAMLRASVGITNRAARKLGCGGKDLPVPEKGTEAASVPPRKTAGTPCAALAEGPLRGPEWTVDVRTSGSGPMSSCSVRPKGHDDSGRAHGPVLQVTGWYGDWSQRFMYHETALRHARSLTEDGARPWMRESGGWAMARCGGQAANFEAWVRDADDAGDDGVSASSLRQLRGMKGGELRRLLDGFVHDQAGRRDCEGLRVPAEVSPEPKKKRR